MTSRARSLLLVLALPAALAGCGGGADLTIYSGRNEELVGDLMKQFEEQSGLDVEVRYADSAELAATLEEEGDASPADVFFAQDAGSLGAVENLLATIPAAQVRQVPARFRDSAARWVGTSARARVVAYSTERVQEEDLPDSIFDFTKPEWKGRIGFPPTNASFQAFISGMRLQAGEQRTRAWLEAVKRNQPKLYENNIQTEEAIARGEVDVGFVNHYYLGELKKERPDFPVANHFLGDGDPGSLVNAAGVGILKTTDSAPEAQRFVRFLLSRAGQQYFRNETFEYPLAAGLAPPDEAPPLDEVVGPDVELDALGDELDSTLKLLDEVGLTS